MSAYKKLTAGELIAKLQQFPPDHELTIAHSDYLNVRGMFQIKHVVEYYHEHGLMLVLETIDAFPTATEDAKDGRSFIHSLVEHHEGKPV